MDEGAAGLSVCTAGADGFPTLAADESISLTQQGVMLHIGDAPASAAGVLYVTTRCGCCAPSGLSVVRMAPDVSPQETGMVCQHGHRGLRSAVPVNRAPRGVARHLHLAAALHPGAGGGARARRLIRRGRG